MHMDLESGKDARELVCDPLPLPLPLPPPSLVPHTSPKLCCLCESEVHMCEHIHTRVNVCKQPRAHYCCLRACLRDASSLQAVQDHMESRGHRRVTSDEEVWLEEFGPFYRLGGAIAAGAAGDAAAPAAATCTHVKTSASVSEDDDVEDSESAVLIRMEQLSLRGEGAVDGGGGGDHEEDSSCRPVPQVWAIRLHLPVGLISRHAQTRPCTCVAPAQEPGARAQAKEQARPTQCAAQCRSPGARCPGDCGTKSVLTPRRSCGG